MTGRDVLACNLRRLRRQAGMTQTEVAKRVGVTRSFISAIEKSKTDVIVPKLFRFAEVLGVDASELLAPMGPPLVTVEGTVSYMDAIDPMVTVDPDNSAGTLVEEYWFKPWPGAHIGQRVVVVVHRGRQP